MTIRIFRHLSVAQWIILVILTTILVIDIRLHLRPNSFTRDEQPAITLQPPQSRNHIIDPNINKADIQTQANNNSQNTISLSTISDELWEKNFDMTEFYNRMHSRDSKETSTTIKFRKVKPNDIVPERKLGWKGGSDDEEPINRFPKAILVGFSKCGTSSLLAFLNVHPDILTVNWEMDYFCDRVYYKYSLHWYRMRMPVSTSRQVTIEKSPCYITESQALARIRAFNSSIKIMVILRDPLKRIISQHGQQMLSFKTSDYKKGLSLESRYVNSQSGQLMEEPIRKWGIYVDRMERLYNTFPREQIQIIDGDRFIKDPLNVLTDIEEFLGVPKFFSEQDVYFDEEKGFYCPRYRTENTTDCLGSQKGRPHVQMGFKLRKRLQDYLRPHSERLFKLIGYRLEWNVGKEGDDGQW